MPQVNSWHLLFATSPHVKCSVKNNWNTWMCWQVISTSYWLITVKTQSFPIHSTNKITTYKRRCHIWQYHVGWLWQQSLVSFLRFAINSFKNFFSWHLFWSSVHKLLIKVRHTLPFTASTSALRLFASSQGHLRWVSPSIQTSVRFFSSPSPHFQKEADERTMVQFQDSNRQHSTRRGKDYLRQKVPYHCHRAQPLLSHL